MISSKDIFSITTQEDFNTAALSVFQYQFKNNKIYRSFCDLLYIHPSDVKKVTQIPFLPITFFKTKQVRSTNAPISHTFTSSGTTGAQVSKHLVADINLYEESFLQGFNQFYGDIEQYTVLALLPSYLEREGSSLIYMVQDLITRSKKPDSGFYLDNTKALAEKLKTLDAAGEKVLLLGVSFALLDLVEQYTFSLQNTIIMETGGMKGRRKEIIREQLHAILKKGFGVSQIHSEYGMTELFSQAYAKKDGIFTCPNWMQVYLRDTEDPLTILEGENISGAINIIDLANRDSCAFIATQDLGKKINATDFSVLGRFDAADVRGCNLMVL